MLIVLIASKVTCQSAIWMAVFVSLAGNISLLRISGTPAFVWRGKYWTGFIWSSERMHVDVIWRFLESMEHSTKLQIVCGCVVGWLSFPSTDRTCIRGALGVVVITGKWLIDWQSIKLSSILNMKEYFQTSMSSRMRNQSIAPTKSTWTLHSLVTSVKIRTTSS